MAGFIHKIFDGWNFNACILFEASFRHFAGGFGENGGHNVVR
jgi:hypothetical protein